MNFFHFLLDLLVKVPGYQLFLMAFLFVIGILLNLVSLQWIQSRFHGKKAVSSAAPSANAMIE